MEADHKPRARGCRWCKWAFLIWCTLAITTVVLFVLCASRGLLTWKGDEKDVSLPISIRKSDSITVANKQVDAPELVAFRTCFVLLVESVTLGSLLSIFWMFNPQRSLVRLGKLACLLFPIFIFCFQLTEIIILPLIAVVLFTFTAPPKLGILIILEIACGTSVAYLCESYQRSTYPFVYAALVCAPSLLVIWTGYSDFAAFFATLKVVCAAVMVFLCVGVFVLDQVEVISYVEPCFPNVLPYKTPLEYIIEQFEKIGPQSAPLQADQGREVPSNDPSIAPRAYIVPTFESTFSDLKNVGCSEIILPNDVLESGTYSTTECHDKCNGYTYAIVVKTGSLCACTHLDPASYRKKAGSTVTAEAIKTACFWSLLSPCWFARPQKHFPERIPKKEMIMCADKSYCEVDQQPCCSSSFVARCPLMGDITELCVDEMCRESCDVPQFCVYDFSIECPIGYHEENWMAATGWEEETLRWEPVTSAFSSCTLTKDCCGVQRPSPWHTEARGKLRMLPCRNFKGRLCRKGFLEYFNAQSSMSCDLSGLLEEKKGYITVNFVDYKSFQDQVKFSSNHVNGFIVVTEVSGSAWENGVAPGDRLIALAPRARNDAEMKSGQEYGWSWQLHLLRPALMQTHEECYDFCTQSKSCKFFHYGRFSPSTSVIEFDWSISDRYFQPVVQIPVRHYGWFAQLHLDGNLTDSTTWADSSLPTGAMFASKRLTILTIEGEPVTSETVNTVFAKHVKPPPHISANDTNTSPAAHVQVKVRLRFTLAPEELTVCRTFGQCNSYVETYVRDDLSELRTFIVDSRGWIADETSTGMGVVATPTTPGESLECPEVSSSTIRPSAEYLSKGMCFAQCEAAQCSSAAYGGAKREYLPMQGLCVDDVSTVLDVESLYVRTSTALGTKVIRNRNVWQHGDEDKGGLGVLLDVSEDTKRVTVQWDWQDAGMSFDHYKAGYLDKYDLIISPVISVWPDGTAAFRTTVRTLDLCRVRCDHFAQVCSGFQVNIATDGTITCTFLSRGTASSTPPTDSSTAFCYGAHADPACSTGTSVGKFCCHGSCGVYCTASSQCAQGAAGREGCCHSFIRSSNRNCISSTPPCIMGYNEGATAADMQNGIPADLSFIKPYDPYIANMCRGNECKCYFIFTLPPKYCLVGASNTHGPGLPVEFWLWIAPISYSQLGRNKECRQGDVARRSSNGWNAIEVPSTSKLGEYSLQLCANQIKRSGKRFFSWHNGECYAEFTKTRLCLPNVEYVDYAYANDTRFGPLNVNDFVEALVGNSWMGGIVLAVDVGAKKVSFQPDNHRHDVDNTDVVIEDVALANIRVMMDPSGWRSSTFSFYEIPRPTAAETRLWDGTWSKSPPTFDCCFACLVSRDGPLLFEMAVEETLRPLTRADAQVGMSVTRDINDCSDILRTLKREGLSLVKGLAAHGCGLRGVITSFLWTLGIAWVNWTYNNNTFTQVHRLGGEGPKTDLLFSRAEQICKEKCSEDERVLYCAFRPVENVCNGYTRCSGGAPGLMTEGTYIVWHRGLLEEAGVLAHKADWFSASTEEQVATCTNCTLGAPQNASDRTMMSNAHYRGGHADEAEVPILYNLMVIGPMVFGGCGYIRAAIVWMFIYMLHIAFLNALVGLRVSDTTTRTERIAIQWHNKNMSRKIAPAKHEEFHAAPMQDQFPLSTTQQQFARSTTQDQLALSNTQDQPALSTTQEQFAFSTTQEQLAFSKTRGQLSLSAA